MSAPAALPRIARLSPQLANRIAAGEVIERPASVIKELLENALDAGATRIKVQVKGAGSELIRVIDNGHGLHPEDMELALQRHATAKLNEQSDLAAISSLGFRGEALPSISSVAAFTMTSRIDGMDRGTQIKFNPESGAAECAPAAHPVGTTVEVSQLFANTPARKKFLRSERTEFLHIQEMVRRLALSRFNFSLELEHDERKIFTFPLAEEGSNQRVSAVMGQQFASDSAKVDEQGGAMRVWGWLGTGRLARSGTDRQYLYLNGRMIQDRRLNHAIRVACEGLLDEGRYPAYVLHLQMDLEAADVNVHPTKHEVRFRHAGDVHDFVFAALRASLEFQPGLFPRDEKSTEGYRDKGAIQEHSARNYLFSGTPVGRGAKYPGAREPGATVDASHASALGELHLQLDEKILLLKRGPDWLVFNIDEAKKLGAEASLRQLDENRQPAARPLLVPVSFEITEAQAATLEGMSILLKQYALEIELNGARSCRLRTLPQLLANADLSSLVDDILNLGIARYSESELREKLIQVMLAHLSDTPASSVRAEELYGLVRQLQDLGLPLDDEHCKPVWTTLKSEDLEKMLRSK